jgi:hypothetical protein
MIVHVLKFSAKPGKEKTVHKIIRRCMMILKDEAHPGTSLHSFRDATDKRHFIQISTFESEEAEKRYEDCVELKSHYSRLNSFIDGSLDFHKMESFEFFQAR